MQYPGCENPSIYVTSGRNQSQPKFHNVNCRFCGAIHNVDRACISVLSQVIRNVNERKTVQTNIISFVSHGTGILKICEPLLHKFLLRSPAECPANRNIIFRLYRFSFSLTYKIPTCERTLISALHSLRKHHKICCSTVS